MKEFKYFVSYFFTTKDGGFGFGNAVVTRTKSISSSKDIQNLAESLSEPIPDVRERVTIISFQELK